MKTKLLVAILALASTLTASADEGMWMIHMIDDALQKKMEERGLALAPGEIYNADAPGTSLADAVVSLEFGCSGSMISDQGLMITNHHCAYGDICSLSTPEHNYLEEGYWAMTSDKEVPIPGKKVLFLSRVIDVTGEVAHIRDSLVSSGIPIGLRKISYLVETKYSERTGLEAYLSSMWAGTKYYLALYQVYSDVRLVAAPPVTISAFGGETDNWGWPQQKCDFAMYRVYTAPDGSDAEFSPDNVPYRPRRSLVISTDGYTEGDFTMVIGYPGRTDRYSSSFKADFLQNLSLPISNEARGKRMEILERWMNSDPDIRLKYSDQYFSLSNFREANVGKVRCFRRFDVIGQREAQEREMQEWIDSVDSLSVKWHDLIPDLRDGYAAQAAAQRDMIWYRESLAICSKPAVMAMRGRSAKFRFDLEKAAEDYDEVDMRVERDLFRYGLEAFYTNFDLSKAGDFQRALLDEFTDADGRVDFDAMTSRLWDDSYLTDFGRLSEMVGAGSTEEDFRADSLFRFFTDINFGDLSRAAAEAWGDRRGTELESEYTRALYQMRASKGETQYPNANSTMRLSYGVVSDLEPWDGVHKDWKTTTKGIIEKFNPDEYDFRPNPAFRELLEGLDEPMNVDFLTDNDITGGNSGSPVFNSKGELIGLAFDGNLECLASDASFTPGYNKCVCVDIRFVLFVLDRYAHMDRILSELTLASR